MMRMNCDIIEDDDEYCGRDCDVLVLSVMMLREVMKSRAELTFCSHFIQKTDTKKMLFLEEL